MCPVILPKDLPATATLINENIFVMNRERAESQEIRPLEILFLNLMPTKIVTETQILRVLSNSLIQINVTFLQTSDYTSKNTPKSHLDTFYTTFEEICDKSFDALIVSGAPVENMEFEEVQYWNELTRIFDFAENNIQSSLFICWGAQAALYYYYGINKKPLEKKAFGIFEHENLDKNSPLMRGLDDVFYAPHSRHTSNTIEDINASKALDILAYSKEAGPLLITDKLRRKVFITGHPEYDAETLGLEYFRDVNAGHKIDIPHNYFIDDNPEKGVKVTWRSTGSMIYNNWLNYYVYQETPYNLKREHK